MPTAEESRSTPAQDGENRRGWATRVFSGKESLYNCQYRDTGHRLEFADAEVRVVFVSDAGVPIGTRTTSKVVQFDGWSLQQDDVPCIGCASPR